MQAVLHIADEVDVRNELALAEDAEVPHERRGVRIEPLERHDVIDRVRMRRLQHEVEVDQRRMCDEKKVRFPLQLLHIVAFADHGAALLQIGKTDNILCNVHEPVRLMRLLLEVEPLYILSCYHGLSLL